MSEAKSPWQHSICDDCWNKKFPHRSPHRLVNPEEETCCFCSEPHRSGIYVRQEWSDMPCNGVHK